MKYILTITDNYNDRVTTLTYATRGEAEHAAGGVNFENHGRIMSGRGYGHNTLTAEITTEPEFEGEIEVEYVIINQDGEEYGAEYDLDTATSQAEWAVNEGYIKAYRIITRAAS